MSLGVAWGIACADAARLEIGRKSALSSLDRPSAGLEIGETFGLQLGDRRHPRRNKLEEGVLAGLGLIDAEALVGDLTEIPFRAIFGQAGESLIELGIDCLLLPGVPARSSRKNLMPAPWATTTSLSLKVSNS